MVDIHSHVLWGMDDGSDSRETSVEMLNVAAKAGTTDIVATPHSNSRYKYQRETIDEQIADLNAEFAGRITVHRGCDFHLSYENIEDALANPRKYTVNGKHFLLVEFADLQIPQGTSRIFEQLMQADMFPIITHPERNPILSKKLDELEKWVQQGSLLQVTARSLEGGFGGTARDAAWKMMSRGLVHFVASDAHDPEFRAPRLDRAYKLVAGKFGEDAAELLCESNPSAVVEGRDPAAVVPLEPVRKRSFFSFLGR
jgi:protein-tyrosine phosphatase